MKCLLGGCAGCTGPRQITLIDLGFSGPKNRNLRRRLRYHMKKFQKDFEAIAGVNPALFKPVAPSSRGEKQ